MNIATLFVFAFLAVIAFTSVDAQITFTNLTFYNFSAVQQCNPSTGQEIAIAPSPSFKMVFEGNFFFFSGFSCQSQGGQNAQLGYVTTYLTNGYNYGASNLQFRGASGKILDAFHKPELPPFYAPRYSIPNFYINTVTTTPNAKLLVEPSSFSAKVPSLPVICETTAIVYSKKFFACSCSNEVICFYDSYSYRIQGTLYLNHSSVNISASGDKILVSSIILPYITIYDMFGYRVFTQKVDPSSACFFFEHQDTPTNQFYCYNYESQMFSFYGTFGASSPSGWEQKLNAGPLDVKIVNGMLIIVTRYNFQVFVTAYSLSGKKLWQQVVPNIWEYCGQMSVSASYILIQVAQLCSSSEKNYFVINAIPESPGSIFYYQKDYIKCFRNNNTCFVFDSTTTGQTFSLRQVDISG